MAQFKTVYGVFRYDRYTHTFGIECYYSSRDMAKCHCQAMNRCAKVGFYKVKSIRVFTELLFKPVDPGFLVSHFGVKGELSHPVVDVLPNKPSK